MERFDLEFQYGRFHNVMPRRANRPVVGITTHYTDGRSTLADRYYKMVAEAGGLPLLIPPLDDDGVISGTLDKIDALLLSGGGDINPLYCGEEPCTGLGGITMERDLPELLLARLALDRQIPLLGICRGIQTLVVAMGGKVDQDIMRHAGSHSVKHSQQAGKDVPTHTVDIAEGTALAGIYHAGKIAVNSFHHQAVAEPGAHLRVSATAADGTIEAVESTEHKSVVGVQWHPEWLADGTKLFEWLVGNAAEYAEARAIHDRVITLDTHCDTPMFFTQGVDFNVRDPRLCVDLHKMTEGRQDAVIMAAYVPQPTAARPTPWDDGFKAATAFDYADTILTAIEEMVGRSGGMARLADTPDDLLRNKAEGVKSVMRAVENGAALMGDPARVEHFARRGTVYITLCHNGDNELCDSARGNATHGGVSDSGAKAIREMNRCGVIVDLSHAAESTFRDALAISSRPVVCSHSSARALCDHPRNLTDSQMKALAEAGGVCQITLYHGFLEKDGEATILSAMEHLDHAAKVMGTDHIGLGTDFDGDGGVSGLACSSELINFTRQLLRRRYSTGDIEKIWGGNFLRVMRQVQTDSACFGQKRT